MDIPTPNASDIKEIQRMYREKTGGEELDERQALDLLIHLLHLSVMVFTSEEILSLGEPEKKAARRRKKIQE